MKIFNISKKTLKNFSYLSVAHITVMFIGLISSVIWTRYTSTEIYGKYQLLVSFISIVGVFSIPGFGMSAQLSSAQIKHGNLKLLFRKKVLWSLISSMLLVSIGSYYQFFKDDAQMAYMLYIVSAIYPFYNLHSIWESWINGIGEFKKLSIIQIYFSIFNVSILTIGLIYINNIYLVILLIFAGIGISNIVILKYFLKKIKNIEIDNDLIHYGYLLSGSMFIPVLLSFDKLLISEYLSFSDVAIYSVALIFPLQIKVLYGIINRLISPHISSASSIEEAWQYLKPKMFSITILFAVIGIIGFYSLEYVINLIFTDKYQNSIKYAEWLWLSLAITIPPVYMANILRAQKIIKFSYYFESFNAIIKFTLFLVLLPIFKLWGVIYALIISYIFSSIFFITYFNIELNKERRKIDV